MKKTKGGCHCGKVQYEVEVDISAPVLECNCSICQGKGLLLSFVKKEQMHIISGEEFLKEYRFNTGKIAHKFCTNCGVQVFSEGLSGEGETTYAVNVRTLNNIDVSILTRMPYDGKAI